MHRRARSSLGALATALLVSTSLPGAAGGDGVHYRLRVNGLSCPFCAYGIEKKLGALEAVHSVEVRLDEGAVIVGTRPGLALTEERARKAVEAAGFGLQGFEVLAPEAEASEEEGGGRGSG